jgi:hypothetical protein
VVFSNTCGSSNARANLNTLAGSADANRIDPYRHFYGLFQQLPLGNRVDDYDVQLPWKMPVTLL